MIARGMQNDVSRISPLTSAITLAIAIAGAALGWAINAPVYMLLGPAIAVTLAGLGGLTTGVDPRLRDLCFLLLGIAVGAGFDADALAAMLRWPLAFAFMALIIWAILVLCRFMLVRGFGFDPRSAILASAPGHLSFVMAIATEGGSDVARISITQSVRLLSLTIVVPFIALAMGIEVSGNVAPQGNQMSLPVIGILAALSAGVGYIFMRLNVPAPLLLGGMAVSALGHVTELTPGVLPAWLILPAYLVLGGLIGTRFSGVTLARLTSGLMAGLAITGVAVGLAALGAVPVGLALGMPLAHVLVAFAPGGFETMIAMGAVLGVIPGFVAACHIMRLVVLSFVLPAMLARQRRKEGAA
jgi:uncharacterized protein